MAGQEAGYAPRSPDLAAYHSDSPLHLLHSPQQPSPYQSTYLASPPSHHYQLQPRCPEHSQPSPKRLARTDSAMDTDVDADATPAPKPRGRKPKKPKVEVDYGTKPAPGVEEGIEVKTKFPVARIKRIMQADEDVGKVAQVTPTAVSKALELFMVSLVTKAAAQARAKSSKKVTAAHLKQAVESDEQFDFLAAIISKVPDAPVSRKDEDGEEKGEGRKKRAAPKRRKKESDDDDF